MVKAKLRQALKLGSSIGITFNKEIVQQFGLTEDSHFLMGVYDGQIIIEPVDIPQDVKRPATHRKVNLEHDSDNVDTGRQKKTLTPTAS
jgi:antitoxin component of MazEF toxin-antitoxin module